MQSQKVEPIDMNAQVHPDLKEAFLKMPNITVSREDITKVRTLFKAAMANIKSLSPSPHNHIPITTKHIPGPKDAPEVLVKIYNSKPDNEHQPALLWIHGGGYILGHPDDNDLICLRIAHETDCVIVSVDYRLAPEHPYPAAIEDCYATLVWIKDSAQELGIDVNKIAVAGQSAGGGLCAALTLMARDRGGPAICFQAPLFSMIDNRNATVSSYEITDPRCWNRDINIIAWEMYLGDHAKGEISPYAAPIHAKDFSGLPPTFTYVGALDVFRDENIEYVTKLLQAKVPVEFHIYPGCYHGFDSGISNAEVSKQARGSIVTAIKKAFEKQS